MEQPTVSKQVCVMKTKDTPQWAGLSVLYWRVYKERLDCVVNSPYSQEMIILGVGYTIISLPLEVFPADLLFLWPEAKLEFRAS